MHSRSVIKVSFLLVCLAVPMQSFAAGSIQWGRSINSAMADAKKSNRLVMLEFYTDWCGYCKKLEATSYQDPKVVGLTNQLIPVKLNAEKEGLQQARQYKVSGFPTIVFVNSEGLEEDRIGGYLPPDPFRQELGRIIKNHRDFPILEAKFKANPSDTKSGVLLLKQYAKRRNISRASAVLDKLVKADPNNSQGKLFEGFTQVAILNAEKGSAAKATPGFRSALRYAKLPEEKAVGHLNLAFCDLSSNRIEDAKSQLKAVCSTPNAPAAAVSRAQSVLDQLNRGGIR